MPNYRRAFRPGGTFFLTLVTEGRAPIFSNEFARGFLHAAIDNCRVHHPFDPDAIVLLPDHFHILLTLPAREADYSIRVSNIKSHFTRNFLATGGEEKVRSPSRVRQRARSVWQRRFWEHTVRDQSDLNNHLDYIHFNPVKHGFSRCPHEWPHSSVHRFVAENKYDRNWCCQCDGRSVAPLQFDKIAKSDGE
jgi:putative transposase